MTLTRRFRSPLLTALSCFALLGLASAKSDAADSPDCTNYHKEKICVNDVLTLGDSENKESVFHTDVVVDGIVDKDTLSFHNVRARPSSAKPAKLADLTLVKKLPDFRGIAVGQHLTLQERGTINIVVDTIYSDGVLAYHFADQASPVEQLAHLAELKFYEFKLCPKNKPHSPCDNTAALEVVHANSAVATLTTQAGNSKIDDEENLEAGKGSSDALALNGAPSPGYRPGGIALGR